MGKMSDGGRIEARRGGGERKCSKGSSARRKPTEENQEK